MMRRSLACLLLLVSSVGGLASEVEPQQHGLQYRLHEALQQVIVQVRTIWRGAEGDTIDDSPMHVLLYETESAAAATEASTHAQSLLSQLSRLPGVKAAVFGEGTGFEGFGSKYSAVYPVLKSLQPDSLVVISDSRDVLINRHRSMSDSSRTKAIVNDFRRHFAALTEHKPNAVVLSAEAQCCVSALTYVTPGDYYHADGSRNQRACASGEEGCLWAGDEMALPWQEWMQSVATSQTSSASYDDVYLNAGLMVGTARNLLRVIEQAQIGKDEDDQAVLTDFMYTHPASIVLDYGQTLFGNNRGGLGGMDDGSCVFELSSDDDPPASAMAASQERVVSRGQLVHTKTHTTPLFLHSPGRFFACQEEMALKLGLFEEAAVATSSRTHRRLTEEHSGGCNYGGNYRNGCGEDAGEGETADGSDRKSLVRGRLLETVKSLRHETEQ